MASQSRDAILHSHYSTPSPQWHAHTHTHNTTQHTEDSTGVDVEAVARELQGVSKTGVAKVRGRGGKEAKLTLLLEE